MLTVSSCFKMWLSYLNQISGIQLGFNEKGTTFCCAFQTIWNLFGALFFHNVWDWDKRGRTEACAHSVIPNHNSIH